MAEFEDLPTQQLESQWDNGLYAEPNAYYEGYDEELALNQFEDA